MNEIKVSTPSRICLFGEHQDYLGLEVIAMAISLRFKAVGKKRNDSLIKVNMSGQDINKFEVIDIDKEITYENNRDYLKSSINVLRRHGYVFDCGFDIDMSSEIPIGKGMSSSTTLVIAFIKIVLDLIGHSDKDNQEKIANLAFEAEVTEFNEPGGLMDHYSSALGGLVHLKFDELTSVSRVDCLVDGTFILFDSLEDKKTTEVLAKAKTPVINALNKLSTFGINGIRDFLDEDKMKYIDYLSEEEQRKLVANIENYKILNEGLRLFHSNDFSLEELGDLLYKHHTFLRDGLEISTPKIEDILSTALNNGALGGKINGSGGGGCCYVLVRNEDVEKVYESVVEKGYKGYIIKKDSGVRRDA